MGQVDPTTTVPLAVGPNNHRTWAVVAPRFPRPQPLQGMFHIWHSPSTMPWHKSTCSPPNTFEQVLTLINPPTTQVSLLAYFFFKRPYNLKMEIGGLLSTGRSAPAGRWFTMPWHWKTARTALARAPYAFRPLRQPFRAVLPLPGGGFPCPGTGKRPERPWRPHRPRSDRCPGRSEPFRPCQEVVFHALALQNGPNGPGARTVRIPTAARAVPPLPGCGFPRSLELENGPNGPGARTVRVPTAAPAVPPVPGGGSDLLALVTALLQCQCHYLRRSAVSRGTRGRQGIQDSPKYQAQPPVLGLRRQCVGGGTNLCDEGLDLSGSWQQGHSATYNAPSRI